MRYLKRSGFEYRNLQSLPDRCRPQAYRFEERLRCSGQVRSVGDHY